MTKPPSPDHMPNCLRCRHFFVTWDPRFPRGCRMFGIKSRELPSVVVYRSTSRHCPAYEPVPPRHDGDSGGGGRDGGFS